MAVLPLVSAALHFTFCGFYCQCFKGPVLILHFSLWGFMFYLFLYWAETVLENATRPSNCCQQTPIQEEVSLVLQYAISTQMLSKLWEFSWMEQKLCSTEERKVRARLRIGLAVMSPGPRCFSAAICFKVWMLTLLLHHENLKWHSVYKRTVW